MTLGQLLSLIRTYIPWLYAGGAVAALLSIRELIEAHKSQTQTIFSLEKEFARARARRGRGWLLVSLAFLGLVAVAQFVVIPSQTELPEPEPTPTMMIIELPTPTAVAATPTRTRIPTRPAPTAAPAAPTPTLTHTRAPASLCANLGVCIQSPAPDEAVSGQVTIRGTAQIDRFQFFKLEYGLGENPEQWHSIADINRTPVVAGVLGVWNLAGFPNGVAFLRLTVVDASGNFPAPFEVRVRIQQ